MTTPTRPLAGFSSHPEALDDLLSVPQHVRMLALSYLGRLVRAEVRGPLLEQQGERDLRGARKLYLDDALDYRLVYVERRAPHNPHHLQGIHLVAVGERRGVAVYETAARRLRQAAGQEVRRGMPARFQAALASSARTSPAQAAASASAPPGVSPAVTLSPAARQR
ncbi:hypothetical protein [Kitasatospora griseola]|uniref:hypothetical protein n=1 Tax=Kitasatospora griseola TaxID=2064 RepID=UPI0016709654|nr:hypothetical protein [Kitasatospora griseola]GGR03491.1 hypothetical protein GCM10010195_68880 [Kitasatospora griseola]